MPVTNKVLYKISIIGVWLCHTPKTVEKVGQPQANLNFGVLWGSASPPLPKVRWHFRKRMTEGFIRRTAKKQIIFLQSNI